MNWAARGKENGNKREEREWASEGCWKRAWEDWAGAAHVKRK
jgi:hypothetical protein